MQGMTSPHDELAALRARAYGPAADIDGDPEALARLRDLEIAAREGQTTTDEASRTAAAEASRTDAASVDAVTESLFGVAGTSGDDPEGSPAPAASGSAAATGPGTALAPPRQLRPIAARWAVAWAASVAAVAVIVGGLVFGLARIPPVVTASGAQQVATLTDPLEASDRLRQWVGGETMRAFAFEGLTVVRTPWAPFAQGSDGECLLVFSDEQLSADGAISGAIYTGCRAGSFPATAALVVGDDSPQPLRDRFGGGTALQFVLDGDVVGVFVGAPIATPTPTVGAAARAQLSVTSVPGDVRG